MRGLAFIALLLAPVTGLDAQQRVVSPAPESLSVTVYRDPDRSAQQAINLDWVGGYALITETRTVDLPRGTSEIRFEGVAETLIPASVIVRGLPAQPDEKNYDARLLSPGALVDAYLGRQVHIRRTNRKTGKVTEGEAIIRSGPNGIVLQTAAGTEALGCTGLPETLTYDHVPEGLSDKPTLAIRATAAEPTRATLQLSYLATQFDWQANYVASIARDGRTLDLFAWLTLANGNDASFPAARTQAVAGKPNRDDESDDGTALAVSPEIQLQCWPLGTTSDVAEVPPNLISASPVTVRASEDIIVSGSRIPEALAPPPPPAMMARQEELGDLKLYRIPEPVTVAANAQKQVALLVKDHVPYARIYQLKIAATAETQEPKAMPAVLRMKNTEVGRLGLPLPAGSVALFQRVGERPMLVGEPRIEDKAIGEDVELDAGHSPDVTYTQRILSSPANTDRSNSRQRFQLEVTNARASPITAEVELRLYGTQKLVDPSRRLGMKDGRHFWKVEVPANGRASLLYTIERQLPARRVY